MQKASQEDRCYLVLFFCYSGAEKASLIQAAKLMKHLRILTYVDEVARWGSIRKAAEHLNVTASAVNRRITDLEAELGAQLFERLPRGVRLSAAGEVFVNYLRKQHGEVERMKSQIEDLKGLRRGTVRIACSQALALEFLPRAINEFRKAHPLVEFDVKVVDHELAMAALAAFEVELVLVFRPTFLANFQPLMTLEQRLVAVMSKDHPLAGRSKLRLRDIAAYPVALPERSIGGRQLLDEVAARTGLVFKIAAESNSFEMLRGLVSHAGLISFQIRIGTMPKGNKLGLVALDMDERDVLNANLVFGCLRDRNLPVATAIFAQNIIGRLKSMVGAGSAIANRKQ
jgi:DNA-binding transcriptional LysR family regulator